MKPNPPGPRYYLRVGFSMVVAMVLLPARYIERGANRVGRWIYPG